MSLLFGGVILFLVYMIWQFIKQLWIINFPWGENRIEDVTTSNVEFFNGAQEMIERLENLGFKPLAVAKVWLFWRRNQPDFTWYFVDSSETTYAEVVENKSKNHSVGVGFSSWFSDNTLIQTFFPNGENIDETNYSSHFVKEDLEGGYAHHQQVLQRFSSTHEAPIIFQNLAKLISYDDIYTGLYRRRHYRRLTIHLLSFIAVSLVSIGVMISAIIAETTAGANVYEVIVGLFTHATLLLLCFIVMGVLLYFLSNPPGALDTHRKRKKTDGGLL